MLPIERRRVLATTAPPPQRELKKPPPGDGDRHFLEILPRRSPLSPALRDSTAATPPPHPGGPGQTSETTGQGCRQPQSQTRAKAYPNVAKVPRYWVIGKSCARDE